MGFESAGVGIEVEVRSSEKCGDLTMLAGAYRGDRRKRRRKRVELSVITVEN
jgi:hypothetical protein